MASVRKTPPEPPLQGYRVRRAPAWPTRYPGRGSTQSPPNAPGPRTSSRKRRKGG